MIMFTFLFLPPSMLKKSTKIKTSSHQCHTLWFTCNVIRGQGPRPVIVNISCWCSPQNRALIIDKICFVSFSLQFSNLDSNHDDLGWPFSQAAKRKRYIGPILKLDHRKLLTPISVEGIFLEEGSERERERRCRLVRGTSEELEEEE